MTRVTTARYVTSGAIAAWQLLGTLDLFRRADSSPPIRTFADAIRSECRWQLDWLMRPVIHCLVWLSTVCTAHSGHRCRVGHTRTLPNVCCIDPRLRRPCTWPRLPHSALGCSMPLTPGTRARCWKRPAPRTRRPGVILTTYAPSEGWHWGSNGRILNNLVVLAVAQLVSGASRYADAVASGMDYLLGRNALGQSYITVYGTDFTCHQRTRQFGGDIDPALPPPPPGALAGGANSQPAPDFPYDPRLLGLPPQFCYLEEPNSEVTIDICIRWNAPLVWVAGYLITLNDQGWAP
jgi:Glycosyl hydrolase family 9